jgi:hypothetical protein
VNEDTGSKKKARIAERRPYEKTAGEKSIKRKRDT